MNKRKIAELQRENKELKNELEKRQNSRNAIKTYMPKQYGFDAFTVYNSSGDHFRAYMMDYFFSTMGEAYVIRFYISRCDLKRHQAINTQAFPELMHDTADTKRELNSIIQEVLHTGKYKIEWI